MSLAYPHVDALWRRGRRLPRPELGDHGRRHDLGVGAAASWRRSAMPARSACSPAGHGSGRLAEEIVATRALTVGPFGVNLIVMHPQLRRAGAGLLGARGRPCRAGRRAAAARGDPAAQGGRYQGGLLRPLAGARQEAGPHRCRCAGDRGHGGRRPYRSSVDLRPGPGDPPSSPRCRCSWPAASAMAR